MHEAIKKISQELLLALLNNPYESLILIDAEGIVRFVSEFNTTISKRVILDAVGRHISEVNPGSELLRTIQTGRAEIGRPLVLDDQERIIARIPLTNDGRIVGAVGKLLLSSPQKVKALYQRIENLETQLEYYKSEFEQLWGARYNFDHIVGRTQVLRDAIASARKASLNDSPVILYGESGTGKEMFAHAIHEASRRRGKNFIRINCAAIPTDLIEAELFGYEPGAFTGARRQGGAGKIELAHNGTLFLDEIAEMPLRMQVKLLRVLQDKVVERIGGGKPRQINFRIISATNQDLEGMIRKGTFRLDLFYRLNVVTISLPALRIIADDIPLLFETMLVELANKQRVPLKKVEEEALEALKAYAWPGNVRELRNVAEQVMFAADGEQVEVGDLPPKVRSGIAPMALAGSNNRLLKQSVESAERQAIEQALRQAGQNKAKASKLLGIHRTGLYQKMRRYGML